MATNDRSLSDRARAEGCLPYHRKNDPGTLDAGDPYPGNPSAPRSVPESLLGTVAAFVGIW
jgi:hypothetical protein